MTPHVCPSCKNMRQLPLKVAFVAGSNGCVACTVCHREVPSGKSPAGEKLFRKAWNDGQEAAWRR